MDIYWISPSGNFSAASNWSTSSGGLPNTHVPDSTDVIHFDNSGGSCYIDQFVNVMGIKVENTYSGTIGQGPHAFVVGTQDASFGGGIFIGSYEPITVYGSLFIDNLLFVSTSDVLSLYGHLNFGSTIPPIDNTSPEGLLTVEIPLSLDDVTSKTVFLPKMPQSITEVALSIVDGVAQNYPSDYLIFNNILTWSGKALDGLLSEGDILRVTYQTDNSATYINFNHNYGEIKGIAYNKIYNPQGLNFWDLTITNEKTPPGYLILDSSSNVEHDLTLTGGYLKAGSDGTINSFGNIYVDSSFGKWSNEHNVVIEMNSSDIQNIYTDGGILPSLYVDKQTDNPVTINGPDPLYINGDFMLLDGTVSTNKIDVKVGVA